MCVKGVGKYFADTKYASFRIGTLRVPRGWLCLNEYVACLALGRESTYLCAVSDVNRLETKWRTAHGCTSAHLSQSRCQIVNITYRHVVDISYQFSRALDVNEVV